MWAVGFCRTVKSKALFFGPVFCGPCGGASLIWSGRQDLNLRPSAPKADALPDCATPRLFSSD